MASSEDTVSVTLSETVTLVGVDGTAVTDTFPITITATASGTAATATTTTNASATAGSYTMSVPPGQVTVTFQNSQLSEVSDVILAAFSTPNVLDVTMTVSSTMTGVVTDAATGNPVSGASVAIFNNSTNKKWSATTNSSGDYTIASVPVGTYDVEVEGEGAATDVNDLSLTLPARGQELHPGRFRVDEDQSHGDGLPGRGVDHGERSDDRVATSHEHRRGDGHGHEHDRRVSPRLDNLGQQRQLFARNLRRELRAHCQERWHSNARQFAATAVCD